MADEEKNPEENVPEEKSPEESGGAFEVIRKNIGDTVAYIILAVGLFLCFFRPFIGGLPVGFVLGLYFSKAVFRYASGFREFLTSEGIFRGFIIIASLVALAISAPGLVLGMFLGAVTRPLFGGVLHDHTPPRGD